MPRLLHAACGPSTLKDLEWIKGSDGKPMFEGWEETRLDIDEQYHPDLVGDIRYPPDFWTQVRLKDVPGWDAVFCSHALEHLHLYDAPRALQSFKQALSSGGLLMLIVPNFEAACRHVVEGHGEKLYDSPAGPIFAHEVIYGKENWTQDNHFQRHLTGYTPDLLRGLIVGCGFSISYLSVDPLNLMVAARKP